MKTTMMSCSPAETWKHKKVILNTEEQGITVVILLHPGVFKCHFGEATCESESLKNRNASCGVTQQAATPCLLFRLLSSYRSYFMCSIARKGVGLCSISFPFASPNPCCFVPQAASAVFCADGVRCAELPGLQAGTCRLCCVARLCPSPLTDG